MLYFWELRQNATHLRRPTASFVRLESCSFYVSKVWSMLNTIDASQREGAEEEALAASGAFFGTTDASGTLGFGCWVLKKGFMRRFEREPRARSC
jgi:hypothetical protein